VDPREQKDLLDGDGETVHELAAEHQALLDAYAKMEGTAPWGEEPTSVELDEMRLNHLRALGYVIKQ
jgi:hypothetical protein